jgi:hypothetical protein
MAEEQFKTVAPFTLFYNITITYLMNNRHNEHSTVISAAALLADAIEHYGLDYTSLSSGRPVSIRIWGIRLMTGFPSISCRLSIGELHA